MSEIVFYEKPGCIGNAKQKALLVSLGHRLVVHDLLRTRWSAAELASYLDGMPVREWFNPSAPRVRDGELDIDALDADAALSLLMAEPLLIRRPLMDCAHGRCAGFVPGPVLSALGVPTDAESLDNCARRSGEPTCDARAAASRPEPARRTSDAPNPVATQGLGR